LCVCALLSVGCGEADEDADSLANGCDITESSCQASIFALTAQVRGQSGATMPSIRTITLEEFAASLEDEPEAPDEGPLVWSEALSLLDLLPEGSSISDELSAAQVTGVAAYYDTETQGITVIDRGPSDPLDDLFVLAHEFVHGLQDAEVGLDAFFEQWSGSTDASVSLRSLVEGEANLIAVGVVAGALERPVETFNWSAYYDALKTGVKGEITASVAPFFTAYLLLPYTLGTEQLGPLWLAGGQSVFPPLYAAPRVSALDWLDDTHLFAASRVETMACLPTSGPPGFVAFGHDSLGPAGLLALGYQRSYDIEGAWRNAEEYRGDSLVVFVEEGVPDSFAAAWRIRLESASAAETWAGRVRAGLGEGAAVTTDDRELLFYAASPEVLAAWTDSAHCGTPEELPDPAAGTPEETASLRRFR
jgi:hypothetical protein